MRASDAYALSLCPGKARMERGLKDIDTAESRQGTRLAGYRAHPEWERKLLVPEEQDLLRIAEYLEKRALGIINLKGGYIEKREVATEWGDGLVTGHPDLIHIYPELDASIIIDDKFGWLPVQPADVNLQLRCYAIMAPTSEVYVAISQPRLPVADRLTLALYRETDGTKGKAKAQIVDILRASEDPEAPLHAGEEQCRFCKARAICPALREAVTNELVPFQDDVAPEFSKRAMLARVEARLAQASDTQMGALLRACALARLVSDPLGDEIRKRIRAGGMKGYSLAKEFDVREIADARGAISLLVLSRLFTRQEILDLCDLSFRKIELAVREKHKLSAKEAKEEINKVLASVTEKETRRPRILPPR